MPPSAASPFDSAPPFGPAQRPAPRTLSLSSTVSSKPSAQPGVKLLTGDANLCSSHGHDLYNF